MRQKTVQNGFFVVLLALTTLAFLELIAGFLMPVFWAVVLATLFYPLQERLTRRLNGRASPAAVLTLVAILLVVILPLFLVGLAVAREVADLYARITAGEIDPQAAVRYFEEALPVVTDFMERYNVELDRLREGLSGTAVAISQFMAEQVLVFGQNALRIAGLFFLMLYILFFFLRDGEQLLETFVWALPLGDERERRLLGRFAEVARATIRGTLAVGAAQGALGALFFWILGLPAPLFWGVIMTFSPSIPIVGPGLVWGPAALYLLFTGEVVDGLVLLIGGGLLIGLVDNVLRPVFVGRGAQMPDFLILLSTLGGLALFGLSGVVLGPMIAAFFLAVWQMFAEEYAEDRSAFAVEALAGDAPEPGKITSPNPVEEAAD